MDTELTIKKCIECGSTEAGESIMLRDDNGFLIIKY